MALTDIKIDYSRILCPVDFSDTSRKAFYEAVGYARHFGAELIILHVEERNLPAKGYENVEEESQLMDRLEAGLVRRLDELQQDGRVTDEDRERITLEIAGGKPWLEIVRVADDKQCDLIIMGTHGHTGIRHMFIGSQAEKVVRRANCHVLCIKPDAYKADLPPRT